MSERRQGPERTVVLSLGSNLGAREEHLLAGVSMLERLRGFHLIALSSLYESSPVGISTEHAFINAVCLGACSVGARELLAACRLIERERGRTAAGASRDRTLDIDIILYGDEIIAESDLVIPHPRFHERLFVLVPLEEICPEMAVPPSGRSVRDLVRGCPGGGWVRRVSGRTVCRRTS